MKATTTKATKTATLQPPKPADLLRESIAYAARMTRGEPRGEKPHIDVMRLAMVRHLNGLIGLPRRCGDPSCRRVGRCVGPTIRCNRDCPPPPMTQEESAKALASFRKLLTREMEKRGEK